MKNVLNLLMLALFLTLSTSCTEDIELENLNTETEINEQIVAFEIEIAEQINAHRVKMGLNVLSNNVEVKSQAISHTSYMVENNTVSHENFQLRSDYLVNSIGAKIVSENVAHGFTSVESLVNAWVNSKDHRKNIEGNYTHFDISAKQCEQGVWYYTNIFIKK